MILIEMTAEQSLSEELRKKACSLYGINEILNESRMDIETTTSWIYTNRNN